MPIPILLIILGIINILLTAKNAKRSRTKMMPGSTAVSVIIILIGIFMLVGPK